MKNTERFGLMLVLGGMLLYVQASKKMFELCDDRIDYLKATVDTQFDIIRDHTISISELRKKIDF